MRCARCLQRENGTHISVQHLHGVPMYNRVLTSKANTPVQVTVGQYGTTLPRNALAATQHSPACRSTHALQQLCAVDVIGGFLEKH